MMSLLLLATTVAISTNDMTGVWMTDSGQAYVFYDSNAATYVDGNQFVDVMGLNVVPNGTVLGYWARRDIPSVMDNRGGRTVPDANGLLKGLAKTDQGTWRLSDLKKSNRGELDAATLTIQDGKPSPAITKKIFFAFGLSEVGVQGRYAESQVALDLNWSGNELQGRMTCYGIEYAISGEVDFGFYRCKLNNPGSGKRTGTMYIAWNPTVGCLKGILDGRSMSADRVLVAIQSYEDKQKPPIIRNLMRKK